ncbi:MAG: hypothetical protein KGS44_11225 [Alphaproteobacteria bacterium]|nr:hypothetical protein [Alphaproteobacteria bacterium]
MDFDDDVDEARARLAAALADEEPGFDDASALEAVLALLLARIKSRRLLFVLEKDEEGLAIAVRHTHANDILGFVIAEPGEYVFESGHDDYFDDFVDEDPQSFAERLYETLRADLPKYEIENEIG